MIEERARELWKEHAVLREGFERKVYKDTLGNPTVGIGHLIQPHEFLRVGDVIPVPTIWKLFDEDSDLAFRRACHQAKEIGWYTPEFICALTSVNFQLGYWTTKFPKTYQALKDGRHDSAIRNIENSKWAKQTPVRAKDFIDAINFERKRNGNH